MGCRVRDHSIWTNRLLLESCVHEASSFLTLTYAPEHEPYQLVPRHLQLFMKRLRYFVDQPLRYFGVGEYGEKSGRPHYHLAVFGLPTVPGKLRDGPVAKAWLYGYSFGGTLQKESASYICGYVTKKLTRVDKHTDQFLRGRHPEFARMSLRPGIGAEGADRLSRFYGTAAGAAELAFHKDVKTVFRQDGKVRQMGRYLVNRIRDNAGIPEDSRAQPYWERINALREIAGRAGGEVMQSYFGERDAVARASLSSWKRVERSL